LARSKWSILLRIVRLPLHKTPHGVSIFIINALIGEEVNPEKKHHQAYTLMGENKPGVVYKRKYRTVEDRIQPITMQLLEEFCMIHNIIGDPLENIPVLLMHSQLCSQPLIHARTV
jgi:hypothetical protein